MRWRTTAHGTAHRPAQVLRGLRSAVRAVLVRGEWAQNDDEPLNNVAQLHFNADRVSLLRANLHWPRPGEPFTRTTGRIIGIGARRVPQLERIRPGHTTDPIAAHRTAGLALATARQHRPVLLPLQVKWSVE